MSAAGAEFEAADKAKEDGEAELTMVVEDLDRCAWPALYGLPDFWVCMAVTVC